MVVDLYQRRGFYGLGDATTANLLDTTGLDLSTITAPVVSAAPMVTSAASSLTSGIDLTSMSPTTLLIIGAGGLWLLSTIFSGGKKAYRTVSRPVKKHRKKKRELAEAGERYEREKKRITEGKRGGRGGGGFF